MGKVNIVWMPKPDCPEAFWVSLKAIKSEEDGIAVLCDAHERGWIEIFGQTTKSIKDIAAVLQEFYEVEVIEGECDSSDGDSDG